MTTRIQRVEPEFSAPAARVVLWRDASAALERLVFGAERLASPTDRLCALYLCAAEPAHAEPLEVLGVTTKGQQAPSSWPRRLTELLRGLDALDDTARVFSGPRMMALARVQNGMRARLNDAGARDRGAGTEALLARVAQLSELELRGILQADGPVVFVDAFALSPVEWALIARAQHLLPQVQIELPLPDLPLNAERARDPLEAGVAWAEQHAGEALDVVLLPRAWGRERGPASPEAPGSLVAWSVGSVYEQVEWVVRDMAARAAQGESYDSMMVVCEDATRRRELLQCMRSASIPSICRSEPGAAFEGYYGALVRVFRHLHAPFPSPVWEGLSTLLLQGPRAEHRRAGEWLAAQRVYVPRVWNLVVDVSKADARPDSAPDAMCELSRACAQVAHAATWPALFEAARALVASLGTESAWGVALAETLVAGPAERALHESRVSAQADVAARARASRVALDALSELERSLHRLDGIASSPSAELVAVALAAAEANGKPASRAAGAATVRVLSAIAEAPVGARTVYLLDMTRESFPARGSDAPLGLDEEENSTQDRVQQQRWASYANLARITECAECTIALVPLLGEGREALEPATGLNPRSAEPYEAKHLAAPDVALRAAREDARRRGVGDDASLGRLVSDAHIAKLREVTGVSRPMPVTRLERFVACPYQGYVASALGARDAERTPWLADARELGSTRHEALHVVFDAVRAELERAEPDEASVVRQARLAFRQWTDGRASEGRGLVDSVDRDALWAMVLRALRMAILDPEYVYYAGELGFGGAADERPPLVVPLPSGALRLMGRIDRVDTLRADKTRLRVVDYKSGTTKPAVREVGTRMLQAPLYALSLMGDTDAVPHAWAYLYPRVGEQLDSQSMSKDESQTGERLDRVALALATAHASIERVRAGDISPAPLDGACAQCEAASVCRYDAAQAGADEEGEP